MSCSQDIRLEAEGAVYHFKFLRWDTDFFGRDCYILDTEKSVLKPSPKIKDSINKELKGSFITAKIAASSGRELFDFLQNSGFRYIDTEIILKYCGITAKDDKWVKQNNEINILELKENRGLPYKELGSSFDKTRFHSDTKISIQKADELWISYIKNYKITPLRRMFVARIGKKVAGAILVGENRHKKEAILSFVTVLNDFRNMGVGSRLIRYTAGRYGKVRLFTETQASNKGALNFYIKNGFSKIENVKTILHKW